MITRYAKQGQDISSSIELDSDILNPEYALRMEFRRGDFSPTSTLLLKIYTLERTSQELVVIGYSALAVFLDKATGVQPTTDSNNSSGELVLNAGAHQLRLYRHGPDTIKPLSAGRLEEGDFVRTAPFALRKPWSA